METEKKYLKMYIDEMSNEDATFLYALFALRGGYNLGTLIDLFCEDELETFDYAYPLGSVEKLTEVYPDAKNGQYVFEYQKNGPAGLRNIKNIIADKVLGFFTNLKTF